MSSEQTGFPLVTLADFDGCVLTAPIEALLKIDMTAISFAYQKAAAAMPSPCKEVFRLLAQIAGIRLDPGERGSVWKPESSDDRGRTLIPSDVRGAQSDVLETVAARIEHPALRARIADVVWSNDKRKAEMAKLAIDAYCDCVEGLLDGRLKAAYPVGDHHLMDAEKPAHRALQIARAITKTGAPLPDRLTSVLTRLYRGVLTDGQPVIFTRMAQLCVSYKIVDAQMAAGDIEAVVAANQTIYPDALRMALDCAGGLYEGLGDTAAEQRCQLGAVRQMLRMRDQCPQAGAKATWVMDALQRLRHIRCEEALQLESELEDELRRWQRASVREMVPIAINVDVPGERERMLETFSKMDFSTALKSFALLDSSPKIEDLRAEALRQAQASPLTSMLGTKYADDQGRTVVNTPGAGFGEPPENWFQHLISRQESIRRAMLVANYIDPVRVLINDRVAIEERHLNPIVWQSHFVPQLQAPLYALGFARFFQGDFPSAAHLLIPQLEPSLRRILKARGADPTKRRDDATEEDRSVDAIIAHHRGELAKILGAPLLDELDRVFNVQPGPALRHDVAHGQMSAGQCYSSDVVYACWLLYRVCCLFLIKHWEERVKPGLQVEEPGR